MKREGSTTIGEGLTRRQFLGALGLGTTTVMVVSTGGLAYRAYDTGVFSPSRGPAFAALDEWRDLGGPTAAVGAAVLAASAHNTQPWRFAVGDDRIDLHGDRSRTTGANDPLFREFHVSLGCALENLVLAARANGHEPRVTVGPGGHPDLIATVNLVPGPEVINELFEAIGDRRSNRSEYTEDPVPDASLAEPAALADWSVTPARLRWLTTEEEERRFADLLVEATRAHRADEDQSRDSFKWWRSSWDAVQDHKDGLNIDGAGLPPLIRSPGRILPAPDRRSADKTFLDRTRLQADSAAAFGLVLVNDPLSLDDQLAGGRLLQRAHLWATCHDLGMQHMNQITERIDRDRQQNRPRPFERPLFELSDNQQVLAAFRIGTPTVEALPSPRRPVEEVLR